MKIDAVKGILFLRRKLNFDLIVYTFVQFGFNSVQNMIIKIYSVIVNFMKTGTMEAKLRDVNESLSVISTSVLRCG